MTLAESHGPEHAGAHEGRPKLAVWKFASCDGCQLTLLNCEDELIPLAGEVEIAYFPEATRAVVEGPYDVSLVEGSITTPEELERIQHVREVSRRPDHHRRLRHRRWHPGAAQLRRGGRVPLDRLRPPGVPVDAVAVDADLGPRHRRLRAARMPHQQAPAAGGARGVHPGRKPRVPTHSVCVECKRRGNVCVTVAHGTPCLGPVTQAGCGALCPSFDRGCYGCFGPQDTPNTVSIASRLSELGMSEPEVMRVFRTFNAAAEPFRRESERHEPHPHPEPTGEVAR